LAYWFPFPASPPLPATLGVFSTADFGFLVLKYHKAIRPSIIAITPIVTPAPIPPASARVNPDPEEEEDEAAPAADPLADPEELLALKAVEPDPVQKAKVVALHTLHHCPTVLIEILDIAADQSFQDISVLFDPNMGKYDNSVDGLDPFLKPKRTYKSLKPVSFEGRSNSNAMVEA